MKMRTKKELNTLKNLLTILALVILQKYCLVLLFLPLHPISTYSNLFVVLCTLFLTSSFHSSSSSFTFEKVSSSYSKCSFSSFCHFSVPQLNCLVNVLSPGKEDLQARGQILDLLFLSPVSLVHYRFIFIFYFLLQETVFFSHCIFYSTSFIFLFI